MPPSPGVAGYAYEVGYDAHLGIIDYTIAFKYRDSYRELLQWISRNQPEQIQHRSRVAVISASPLRIKEARIRAQTSTDYGPKLRENIIPDNVSHEILSILRDSLNKYLRYDRKWKNKYINERWRSSTGEGLQWNRFRYLDDGQWKEILTK
jgi:hypothetical protein